MPNQYIGELLRGLANRYSIEAQGMDTAQWICANTTLKSKRFSFDDYPFQRAIAADLHPNLDVLKISQVGLTEIQIRKALAMLIRNPGMTGIFSLPNEKMYRRFSQSRLKPLVDENHVFRPEGHDAVRSMDLMQFGGSYLNIVNATEGSATSIPADFVMNDEVDLSDQKILALFSSRLQNSKWKIRQRFSTPTWTNFGIDATYSVSDQREYFCRCSACNHNQVPLFTRAFVHIPGLPADLEHLHEIDDVMVDHLDLENAFVACERCGAPLDLGSSSREWVAAFPSREHARGYRVRPFSSTQISISYIVTQLLSYRRNDFIRGWWNTVLGEPYTDSNARLEEDQIKACMTTERVPEISSDAPVYVGIDMGQICHITLGTPAEGKLRVFEFRAVPVSQLPQVVSEYAGRYKLVAGCCDRHPYTPTVEALREMTESRVMPLEYRGDPELKPIYDVEKKLSHWQANRTKLLDAVASDIRGRRIEMAGYGPQASVIIEHLRDQIRVEEPEKPAKWVKLTGVDHYAHALAFLHGATKLRSVQDAIEEPDRRDTLFVMGGQINVPGNLLGNLRTRYDRELI